MSIYDTISNKHQPAPDYPNRSKFTKWYGYAGGKTIGLFENGDDAMKAGAVTVEKTFDEDGFKAVKAAYDTWNSNMMTEYHAALRAEYPELNDAVYALVYTQAYEDGHSAGHGEVENYLIGFADLAQKIMAAA